MLDIRIREANLPESSDRLEQATKLLAQAFDRQSSKITRVVVRIWRERASTRTMVRLRVYLADGHQVDTHADGHRSILELLGHAADRARERVVASAQRARPAG